MYLHLGSNVSVPLDDIIGIFDLDITSQSHITREFLRSSEKRGIVMNAAEDIPKSFIVCGGKSKTVYLCQPAATTLLKRAEGNTL